MDLDELINEFEHNNVSEEFNNYDENKNIHNSEINRNIRNKYIKIDDESYNFLKSIKEKKDKNLNIKIQEKLRIIDISIKFNLLNYKIEELSGISPQCQRY